MTFEDAVNIVRPINHALDEARRTERALRKLIAACDAALAEPGVGDAWTILAPAVAEAKEALK